MKQAILMICMMVLCGAGAVIHPFWGIFLYYTFAVLRPEYLWFWALPNTVRWSLVAACVGIFGVVLSLPRLTVGYRWNPVATLLVIFAALVMISTLTAVNTDVAQRWAIEYGKMATRPGSPFLEVYEGLARNKYKSPMNMAVADWFQEPKIENVDLSRYHGLVGDVIFIRAGKVRGPIAGVEVVVLDQEGCEVERGNAVQDPMLADEWSYTATSAVVTRKAKVMVTVKDLPGNTDEDRLEKKLEDN